jgi:hypothetical protein
VISGSIDEHAVLSVMAAACVGPFKKTQAASDIVCAMRAAAGGELLTRKGERKGELAGLFEQTKSG